MGTKWIFRIKLNGTGVMIRNKAILMAKWYNSEEGIDLDEIFALIAKLEAICILFAFASYMGIKLYQMDIKWLNGFLNEEVYVE